MENKSERYNLMAEMIAFSRVDGKLHERELQFLSLVAIELRIPKDDFDQLFHMENEVVKNKSEFQRIQQFYRLALLMHSDGVLHEKEEIAINEIAINMALNPFAIKRVLRAMEESETGMIEPSFLIETFKEQHN